MSGTTGAADTVYVRFRHIRQIVIDDDLQFPDVDATGSDVRSDHHPDLAGLEIREYALAVILRLVAMNRLASNTRLGEQTRNIVRSVFGAGEDENGLILLAEQDTSSFFFSGFSTK